MSLSFWFNAKKETITAYDEWDEAVARCDTYASGNHGIKVLDSNGITITDMKEFMNFISAVWNK